MMTSSPSYTLATIYLDAIKQIEDLKIAGTLSQDDFNVITTTQNATQFVHSIKDQTNGSSRFPRTIQPMLFRIERFSSAIDMLAQSSPQILGINIVGLIWGSLKFVLIVARDIADTLDNVVKTLEQISNAFPTLETYIRVFGSSELQLLKEPLTSIYAKFVLFGLQAVKTLNRTTLATLGRSAFKTLQLEVASFITSISDARIEIDTLAGAEHMHQSFEAGRVQLLENQKAEEFREVMRNAFAAGTANGASGAAYQNNGFNAAPLDLLSPHFGGRDAELAQLQHFFSATAVPDIRRCTVFGMPGVGKTQVALKYSNLTWNTRYSYVFWLHANTIEKIHQSFASLLNLVGHMDRNHPEQPARLTSARRWLENCRAATPRSWLLIVDNVNMETLSFLREHIPRSSHGGDILFTTRTQSLGTALAQSVGSQSEVMALKPPSALDAAHILLRNTGVNRITTSPTHLEKAVELVEKVGCLPLAVDQAACFMKQESRGLEDLLSFYRSRNATQFTGWQNELSTYEQLSISATFDLQFKELERQTPEASELLHFLTYLDIESIPVQMINSAALLRLKQQEQETTSASASPRRSQKRRMSLQMIRDKMMRRRSSETANDIPTISVTLLSTLASLPNLENNLRILQNFSLIDQQQVDGNTRIRMHDLIQCLAQEFARLKGKGFIGLDTASFLVCTAFAAIDDPSSHKSWPQSELFIPHIQALTKSCSESEEYGEQLRVANISIAEYFRARGRYTEAKAVFQNVLSVTEKRYGRKDQKTLQAKQDMASIYKSQGRHGDAELMLREVLEEQKATLGGDDFQTLRTAQKLASVCMELGNYEEAVKLSERTLARLTKAAGPEHIETIHATQNLAWIYEKRGELEEAEELYEQALEARKRQSGPSHPEIYGMLHNLAVVYSRQGRSEKAKPLYEQALEWRRTQLGNQHPETLSALQNLALAHHSSGNTSYARTLCIEALDGRRKALGTAHLATLETAQNLAMMHAHEGEFPQADELYQYALAGFEAQLRPDHPSVLKIVHNLAFCYERQGRTEEAVRLYERALEGREKELGAEHQDTLRTRARLSRAKSSSD